MLILLMMVVVMGICAEDVLMVVVNIMLVFKVMILMMVMFDINIVNDGSGNGDNVLRMC